MGSESTPFGAKGDDKAGDPDGISRGIALALRIHDPVIGWDDIITTGARGSEKVRTATQTAKPIAAKAKAAMPKVFMGEAGVDIFINVGDVRSQVKMASGIQRQGLETDGSFWRGSGRR